MSRYHCSNPVDLNLWFVFTSVMSEFEIPITFFQRNQLELVDVRDISSLVYVDLSENKLTSVHGLEGCSGVRYLSLANNNLTRIGKTRNISFSLILILHQVNSLTFNFPGGLESLVALHTLDVSHNQLINCHGLQDVITVQRLNLSYNHIPALDDVKPLGLLQYLDASHNNIMQVIGVKEIW